MEAPAEAAAGRYPEAVVVRKALAEAGTAAEGTDRAGMAAGGTVAAGTAAAGTAAEDIAAAGTAEDTAAAPPHPWTWRPSPRTQEQADNARRNASWFDAESTTGASSSSSPFSWFSFRGGHMQVTRTTGRGSARRASCGSRAVAEMRRVAETKRDVLDIDDAGAAAEILVNGEGDDAHETFDFPLAPFAGRPPLDSVKIAMKPYDAAVTACLSSPSDVTSGLDVRAGGRRKCHVSAARGRDRARGNRRARRHPIADGRSRGDRRERQKTSRL